LPADREVDDLLRRSRWELLVGHFGDGLRAQGLIESLQAADSPASLADLSAELVQEIAAGYGPSDVILPAIEVLIAITGEGRPCSGPAASVIVDVTAELLEFADGESEAAAMVQRVDVLTLNGFPKFMRLLKTLKDPVDIDACIRLVGFCAEMDAALSQPARQAIEPYLSSDIPRIRRLASVWFEMMNGQA
jgi:hypothetical protein